jgi:hypothetical protein
MLLKSLIFFDLAGNPPLSANTFPIIPPAKAKTIRL